MERRYRIRPHVLAAAIERSRLSQNRWAQRLGLSKSYLSQLVNGHRRDPSPEVRERLLEALDLELDELFEVEHGPLLSSPRRSSKEPGLWRRMRAALDGARIDLRAALRGIRRRPLPALLAILALALGVGANSLVFSLVRGVLLTPLPWPEAERMVRIWEEHPERGLRRFGVSPANYLDWREASETASLSGVASLAAFDRRDLNLARDVTALRVSAVAVDGRFFDALGVEAIEGRVLEASGDATDVAVISDGLRRRLFGPAERAVGATLELDGRSTLVVGVVASELAFPPSTEVWLPLTLGAREAAERDGRWLAVVGRLADGATLEAARGELARLAERLATEYPRSNEGWGTALEGMVDVQVGTARRPLALLWLATFVVLAVACVDIALLTLARTAARRRELAVRSALGAGGGRLVRQLMVETALIAGVGALCGVFLAVIGLRLVRDLAAGALPRLDAATLERATLDPWVLAFTLGLSLFAALASALIPAIAASRRARLTVPQAVGVGRSARHGVLVAAQVALASSLLIVAALVGRSLQEVLAVDVGFEPTGLLEARIEPPMELDVSSDRPLDELFASMRDERTRVAAVYERLLAELETVPGVEAVAAINRPPLDGRSWYFQVGIDGAAAAGDEPPTAQARVVTPGYFEVAGIRRLAGRGLEARDRDGARRVAVIDRRAAEQLFGAGDGEAITAAVGRGFRFLGPPDEFEAWTRYEVVGVVDSVRQSDLESPEAPTIYFSVPQALSGHFEDWGMTVLARTGRSVLSIAPGLREAAGRVLPNLPLFAVDRADERIGRAVASRRLQTILCGAFAALTLLLAAVGLYGVVAGAVERRRRELGLRAALGAEPGRLVASTCGRGLRPVVWGLGAGVLVALLAGRWVEALLYEVDRFDPAAFAAAASLLVAVALVATWLPARRAASADPTAVLRDE